MAIILAIVSGINAFSSAAKKKQAEAALESPIFSNGFAAETVSKIKFREIIANNENQFPNTINQSLFRTAISSFISEPTASEAIVIAAFSKEHNIRSSLIKKSYNLSRRDQLITAWLIFDSSNRGNIDDLLQYYDVSIRTRAETANLLLPIMASALENKLAIGPFYNLLSKSPPWVARFWRVVSTHKPAIENTAILREKLFDIRENAEIYSDTALIQTLLQNHSLETATKLRSMLIGDDKNIQLHHNQAVTNHKFVSSPQYAPLDWQLYSNGEYGSSISNNSLYLSAIRNSGGLFARQLIYLSPHKYDVKINLKQLVSKGNRISLQLSCAEKKDRLPNPVNISLNDKNIERSLDNKADTCRYYWLKINGRASDNENGLDAIITSISIKMSNI